MSIAVTGASGFIGLRLVTHLTKNELPVMGVSRSAPDKEDWIRVGSYLETPHADVTVHCAQLSDRGMANSLGDTYRREHIALLQGMLGRTSHMVFVSSAAVYGDESASPRRVADPVYASDVYTAVKLECESRVLEAGGSVVRLANVYGPGMSSKNVVSAVIDQLDTPGPMFLRDLTPVRDFVYVDDVVRGLASCVRNRPGGCWNVGSGRAVSIDTLARTALACVSQEGRIIRSAESSRQSQLVLDVAETIARLDWVPMVSLQQGLKRQIEHFHTHKLT